MARKRSHDTLIGGSVGWNQLCNDSSVTVQSGHKYYMSKGGAESIGASAGTAITGLTSGMDMLIDLTLLLGSTIADNIYGLEQATAGAGVAWFRKLFPKPYYAHNPGELMSVQAVEKKCVGFNQFDRSRETVGVVLNANGTTSVNSTFSVSDYIPVLPNTAYYFKNVRRIVSGYGVAAYDENKTFLETIAISGGSGHTSSGAKTTPDGCSYVRICYESMQTEVCLNISNADFNGQYRAYEKHNYHLDSSLTLRGIPKIIDGKLWYDGDRYESDGTVTRKYGVVDLGTLDWINAGANKMFYANALNADIGGARAIRRAASQAEVFSWGIDSKALTKQSYNSIGTSTPNSICISTVGNILATLDTDTGYENSTAFKAAMDGVMLVYELATPTTEQSTPFTNPQICDPDGTEEYVTANGVPVGHETRYQL